MPEVHPAITEALERRAVLRWAYENDPQVRESIRQLNVVLLALQRHMPDLWLARALLDDPSVLPTDQVLLDRQREASHRLREAMRSNIDPPQVVSVRPCPECIQGKCPNCTKVTLDDADNEVPCPCTHDGQPGAGFLVIPDEMRAPLPEHACLLAHLPGEPAHDWWYTPEGGGHMLSGEPDEGDRRRAIKQWRCPGRPARLEGSS